jgi:hypothetical protein
MVSAFCSWPGHNCLSTRLDSGPLAHLASGLSLIFCAGRQELAFVRVRHCLYNSVTIVAGIMKVREFSLSANAILCLNFDYLVVDGRRRLGYS